MARNKISKRKFEAARRTVQRYKEQNKNSEVSERDINSSAVIQVGCFVRYNNSAHYTLEDIIPHGNPTGQVTKIDNEIVHWGKGNITHRYWLMHA